MDDIDDIQIEKLLNNYKLKRISDKQRYENIRDDIDFKIKNRKRAKIYYLNNKTKIRDKYIENSEYIKARNSYYYYFKNDKIDKFIEKYPERYDLIKNKNIKIIKI